jgi:hypothetical protein
MNEPNIRPSGENDTEGFEKKPRERGSSLNEPCHPPVNERFPAAAAHILSRMAHAWHTRGNKHKPPAGIEPATCCLENNFERRFSRFCRRQYETHFHPSWVGRRPMSTDYESVIPAQWFEGRDKFSTARDADNAGQRAVPTILARISGEA